MENESKNSVSGGWTTGTKRIASTLTLADHFLLFVSENRALLTHFFRKRLRMKNV